LLKKNNTYKFRKENVYEWKTFRNGLDRP
jgi:hypothetical protein